LRVVEGLYSEVTLRVGAEAAEAVAEALREATGAGAVIEPPFRPLGPEEGFALTPDGPWTVRAYLTGRTSRGQREGVRRALRARGLPRPTTGRLRWREVAEEDWAEGWKEHYQVERVGRVIIRPAWRDHVPEPGEVVVSLEPGLAFGTGQHPTTRMCLALLQELLRTDDSVLDLGTGSGVLAIAAVALGAGRCLAVDLDEVAVRTATANAALNGVSDRMEVRAGSMEAAAGERFDIVLANINAGAVLHLAPRIAAALRRRGALVAGGLIEEREAEAAAALVGAGLEVEDRRTEGEWVTLVARRPR
jgi:ribosomal protein L11 methyltransferase